MNNSPRQIFFDLKITEVIVRESVISDFEQKCPLIAFLDFFFFEAILRKQPTAVNSKQFKIYISFKKRQFQIFIGSFVVKY